MRILCYLLLLLLSLIPKLSESSQGWIKIGPNLHGPYGFAFHPTKNLIFTTGASLMRSTDDGRTWQDTRNGVSYFKIDPFNPDSMIAISHSVLESTNAGFLWKEVSRYPFGFEWSNSVWDFEFHSTKPNILYAVTKDGSFVKSLNRGKAWERLSLPQQDDLVAVEVDPANGDRLFLLGRNFLFESGDGGTTFISTPHDVVPEYYLPNFTLDKRSSTMYVNHAFGMYRSNDAGKNWQKLNCGCTTGRISIDPFDSNKLYFVGDPFQQLPARMSLDGGNSWKRVNGLPNGVVAIEAHPRIAGYLIASSSKGVHRSINGGNSWLLQRGIFPFSPTPIVPVPSKPGRILSTGSITNDYGKTWRTAFKDSSIQDLKLHPINKNLIVAGGYLGISFSSDAGSTWSAFSGPRLNEILLDPRNQKVVYALTAGDGEVDRGRIVKTANLGKTWKFVDQGIDSAEETSAIALDPVKTTTLYAASGFRKILSSSDDGKTWSEVATVDFPIFSLVIHPKKTSIMYVNGGSYRSTDRGKTWTESLRSFQQNLVIDDAASTLFSTGDALYVSTDDGKSWSLFDGRGLTQGITDSVNFVNDLAFNPWQPGGLYLSGNRGFFTYDQAKTGPDITQVFPMPARRGQRITIVGNGFGLFRGKGQVLFNKSVKGNVISWSDNRISVIVPKSALPGEISILNDQGNSTNYGLLIFPDTGKALPSTGSIDGGTRIYFSLKDFDFGHITFGDSVARDVVKISLGERTLVSCLSPPGKGTVSITFVLNSGPISLGTFTYK